MHIVIKIILGIAIGSGLGFGFYKLVGCSTGACPLTSNPYMSMVLGGLLGVLIAASA